MTRMVVSVALALVLLVFAMANLQVVELQTRVAGEVRASLAFLLFGAFACGFGIAILWGAQLAVKRRLRERAETQAWDKSEAALLPPPPQVPWPEAGRKPKRSVRPEESTRWVI